MAKTGAAFALGAGFCAAAWLNGQGLTAAELQSELRRGSEPPRFEWSSVDKRHWQARSASAFGVPAEAPAITDAREGNSAGCPSGMVRVKGMARSELHGKSTGEIERLQDTACVDWISRDFPARCRTFDREKIEAEVAKLPTRAVDYCIDRFEYPNLLGQNPMIVVTFREAAALCKKDKKRLCTENEWTFACEGEEVRPYPYGWTRDATACVVDRSWRPFAEGALSPRDGAKARDELDRLWQGEPSGSRASCKSPFGVYDMTGNVDEWTQNVNATGYASVLKGGYWGPVRARCRPSTRAHNEDFVAYQQGFRCCAESDGSAPAPMSQPTMASRLDGGSHVGTVALPPDGQRPVADITPEWPDDDSDDEIAGIRRSRVRSCTQSNARTRRDGDPVCALAACVGVVAMIARRRGQSSAVSSDVASSPATCSAARTATSAAVAKVAST